MINKLDVVMKLLRNFAVSLIFPMVTDLLKKKKTKPKCNASSPSVIGKDANVNCALEEFQYIAYLGLHEPCK